MEPINCATKTPDRGDLLILNRVKLQFIEGKIKVW